MSHAHHLPALRACRKAGSSWQWLLPVHRRALSDRKTDREGVEQHQGIAGGKINESPATEPQHSTAINTQEAFTGSPSVTKSPALIKSVLWQTWHLPFWHPALKVSPRKQQHQQGRRVNNPPFFFFTPPYPLTPPTHLSSHGSSFVPFLSPHLSPPPKPLPLSVSPVSTNKLNITKIRSIMTKQKTTVREGDRKGKTLST